MCASCAPEIVLLLKEGRNGRKRSSLSYVVALEINKLSQKSHCEPKCIHNLKPILYVGVQSQSYSWMCVGGKYIVLGFLRAC